MSKAQVYTAIVTPFDSLGKVDIASFEKLFLSQISSKLDGVVVFGTTGECSTLSLQEKLFLLEKSISLSQNQIKIMANTGTNSTIESVELTKEAKNLKVDEILAIVPYYNKPQPQGIIKHFHAIADVGVPTYFYHHPGRCGIKLEIDTIIEIAKHPMIKGVKECSNDKELIQKIKEKTSLKIFSGNDDTLSKDYQLQLDGIISVVAQLFPEPFLELFRLGSMDKLIKLQPVIEAVFSEINPQGIKAALECRGYESMYLRLPMTQVQLKTLNRIKQAIEEYQHQLSEKLDLSIL